MKSTKSRRMSGTLRALLLGSVALGLAIPAQAGETKLENLEAQMQDLMRQMQALKQQQAGQQQQIEAQKSKIDVQDVQIEAQQQQIAAQQEQVIAAPAQAVTAGDAPGSFKLPGSDTSIKIGGYVKADLFYDVNEDVGNSFNTTSIPTDGSKTEEGNFRAQARQSRVNVQSWTPTSLGVVSTKIEGDFLGSGGNELFSNSTTFRLRHAFGKLTGEKWDFLFGQTWTNFMNLASYPDTVDFFGPTGIPFIRQGQARITYKGIENVAISVSAENSELNARDSTGARFTSESGGIQFGVDSIPDFIGAVEYNKDGYNFRVAGVGRLLETETNPVGNDSEAAWGVIGAGVIPIPAFNDDSLQLNFTYGDGVGRYLINGFLQDASINATTGQIDTIKQWGVAAGFTHHWSGNLRSNVVYGHTEFDDTFAATDFESLDTVHVNMMWTPADNYQLGIEYIYGKASFQSGSLDNDANRVQFGAQYFF